MRKTNLVISSSSVALQEQLVNKDLPLLARHMPEPFTFAIAKGRGRYECRAKLLQRALVETASADLLGLEDEAPQDQPAGAAGERVQFYRRLADALDGSWNGDRDALRDASWLYPQRVFACWSGPGGESAPRQTG